MSNLQLTSPLDDLFSAFIGHFRFFERIEPMKHPLFFPPGCHFLDRTIFAQTVTCGIETMTGEMTVVNDRLVVRNTARCLLWIARDPFQPTRPWCPVIRQKLSDDKVRFVVVPHAAELEEYVSEDDLLRIRCHMAHSDDPHVRAEALRELDREILAYQFNAWLDAHRAA